MVAIHETYSCSCSTGISCCLSLLYFCTIAAFSSLQSLLIVTFEVKDGGWHMARREQVDSIVRQAFGVVFT